MEKGRNGIYNFICDTSVPESNGPDPVSNVTKKNKTKTKKTLPQHGVTHYTNLSESILCSADVRYSNDVIYTTRP